MARKRKKKQSVVSSKWAIVVIIIVLGVIWRLYFPSTHAEAESVDSVAVINEGLRVNVDSLMLVDVPDNTASELLRYCGFNVGFNADCMQPNWVAWELTGEEVNSTAVERANATFLPDIAVAGCASLDDYKRSGFDRGHMCPAADMKWKAQAMDDCHLLTNICPQDHGLNGGAWNSLENLCRNWAQRDSAIFIVCGPVLTDRFTRTIGPNKVPVPERFFKVVLAPYAKPMRAIGFIMPNTAIKGGVQTTAVSVDEVEAITGLDFFASLPDEIENQVESQCNFPQWTRR